MILVWWGTLSPLWQTLILAALAFVIPEIILSISTQTFGIVTKSIWNGYRTLAKQTELVRKARFGKGKLDVYWKNNKKSPIELRLEEKLDRQWGSGEQNSNVLNSGINNRNPILILGEPGAGKSIILANWEQYIGKKSYWKLLLIWLLILIPMLLCLSKYPDLVIIWAIFFILWEPLVLGRISIPVFIEAHSTFFDRDPLDSIEYVIKKKAGEKLIYGGRRQTILLIDGINEIQSDRFIQFVEVIRQALLDGTFRKIVCTSRLSEDYSSQLGIKNVFRISSLNDDEVERILLLYKSDNQSDYSISDAHNDFSELEGQGYLEANRVGRNVFWLEMIATAGMVYENRASLVEHYVNTLLTRDHNKLEGSKKKRDWQLLPIDVETGALGVIALEMNQRTTNGILGETSVDDVANVLKDYFQVEPYRPWDVFWEADAATILRFNYKNLLEFRHPILQEFLASYRLISSNQWHYIHENADNFWWWPTFIMLIRQSDQREEIIKSIIQREKPSFRGLLLGLGLMSKIQEEDLFDSDTLSNIKKMRENERKEFLADWTTWSGIDFYKFISGFPGLKTDLLASLDLALKDGVTKQNEEDFENAYKIFGTSFLDYCGKLVFRWGRLPSSSVSVNLMESILALCKSVNNIQAANTILFATLYDSVREKAIRVLVEMGETGVTAVLQALKDSITDIHGIGQLLQLYGENVVPMIETAILQTESLIRIDLIKALVDISTPSALAVVEKTIRREENFTFLVLYIDYVKKLDDSITFPWFIKMLKSENLLLQSSASAFLKKDPERAVKAILELIKNGEVNFSDLIFVVDLLQLPELQSLIAQEIDMLKKPNDFMQYFLLAGISSNENIPYEVFLEKLKNPTTASQAINLFSMVGKPAISHLLPLLDIKEDTNIRVNALGAIKNICIQEIVDIPELTLSLIKSLLDPTPEIQNQVTEILPLIGSPVQPFLVILINSEDSNLRKLVMQISSAMLPCEDNKVYYGYLQNGLSDADEGIRELCFRALVVSGNLVVFRDIVRNLSKRGFNKSFIALRVYFFRIFQANYHMKICQNQIRNSRNNKAYTTCMKILQNKVMVPAFQSKSKSASFSLEYLMTEADLNVQPVVMRNAVKKFAKEKFNQGTYIAKINYITNQNNPIKDVWNIEFKDREYLENTNTKGQT